MKGKMELLKKFKFFLISTVEMLQKEFQNLCIVEMLQKEFQNLCSFSFLKIVKIEPTKKVQSFFRKRSLQCP